MVDEIREAIDSARNDKSVGWIGLCGVSSCFCAGADINDLTDVKSPAGARGFSGRYQGLFKVIIDYPKPTIAAVRGFALGGGFELAISCDLIVATEDARFGVPEIRLGALPAGGGTVRLAALTGEKVAKQMLLLGEKMTAKRMFELGVVAEVVDNDKLLQTMKKIGEKLATQSLEAVREIKSLLRYASGNDLDRAFAMENDTFVRLWGGKDFKEGVSAFFEKRKPVFNKV